MKKDDDKSIELPAPLPPDALKAALELWGQAGEAHFLPVRGMSMLPLLRDGDHLLLAHGYRDIRRGDIVVFQRLDGLIAHRVLQILDGESGRALVTKGDYVSGLDPQIAAGELLGRVLAVRHGERQMRLDTRAWRRAGEVVAWVMLAETWFFRKLTGGRGGENDGGWLSALFNRAARIVNYLALRGLQALIGRWEVCSSIRGGGRAFNSSQNPD